MTRELIIGGFGGQGVMAMGKMLIEAGLLEGLEVSWVPSYGPEMRGGTANCSVVLSKESIGSPVFAHPTELIAMNGPSLHKFEGSVQPGGLILINSSQAPDRAQRGDVVCHALPCMDIAMQLGNAKVANMVMLGAYVEKAKCVDAENILAALGHKLGEKKAHLIPLNR